MPASGARLTVRTAEAVTAEVSSVSISGEVIREEITEIPDDALTADQLIPDAS